MAVDRLVLTIVAIAFASARMQGPVAESTLTEQADAVLQAEGEAISAIDGDVTK